MDGYLSKPFTQQKLREALQQWLPDTPVRSAAALSTAASVPGSKPADATDELLDTLVLERIRTLQRPGRPPVLKRVIRAYLESAPLLMEGIRTAVADGDTEALGDQAHSLKSSSANLGARELSGLCRQLETAGRENRLEDAEILMARFDSSHRKTLEALKKEFAEEELQCNGS